MIGFAVQKKQLEDLVEQHRVGWLARAEQRTNDLIAQGKYDESSPIWSEIKEVFYDLQHGKCAYCERPLASKEYGLVESDVEHYRPKSVYYWLAYDLENYAVACQTCNRTLKNDDFPRAGKIGKATQSSKDLDNLEKPLLLFPFRDNPEDFIGFIGAIPKPKSKSGYKRERAKTSIEFFRLDDELREELYAQRFSVIREMFTAYSNIKKQHSPELLESDKNLLSALINPRSSVGHIACAKAYLELLESDFLLAWKIRQVAVQYTVDKTIPKGSYAA